MNEKSQNQTKSLKKLLLIALIALIVGHIGMYVNQRSEWLYDGQPYKKAKEWLIGANFMMVYGHFLTKLPFVDEKSFIVLPVLALQDYFIKRWKENLPGDDAEKYADRYVFRLMMYIAFDRIYLYMKYNMFQEIRYAAFNNSSVIFSKNVLVNWSDIENKNGQTSVSIRKKKYRKTSNSTKDS